MAVVDSGERVDWLHFNVAGAGVPSTGVTEAIQSYLRLEQRFGPYEAEALHGQDLVTSARESIARLMGAEPAAIALFDNATRAWTTLVGNLALGSGDVVWVSEYDYVGNLFLLTRLRDRLGIQIEVMPSTPRGDLDLDWAERNFSSRVALVSVSHIPSCCGVVVDVAGLGMITRGSRAVLAVDGCQAVGNIAVDVTEIGCDIYTGAGRKFLCGPRGTGFAYLSPKYLAAARPLVLDVHAMAVSPTLAASSHAESAADFELCERNFAVWAGLRVAADEHLAQDETAARRRRELFGWLEGELCALPGIRRLGEASRRSGIVSLMSDRVPVGKLYAALLDEEIRTWLGDGAHTPLYAPRQGASEFLRISLGSDLTPAAVERLLRAMSALLGTAG